MLSRISKWGNSLAIRIPKAFIEDAGLEDGVEVDIAMEGGRIVLTPVGREYTLDELVEKITPQNLPRETDWGEPTGAEVW